MAARDSDTITTQAWDAPPDAALRPGFISRKMLKGAAKGRLDEREMWIARLSDPRENMLIDLMDEAARKLDLKKKPKLLLFKSAWPEAIDLNRKYLAISTGLAETLSPEQTQAMMEQQLEARRHATGRFLTKWGSDVAVIYAGAAGGQYLASKKWESLKPPRLQEIMNGTVDKKTLLKTIGVFGAAKYLVWETLERWKDRKHAFEQDAVAAGISGKQTMLGGLEAIQRREEELGQQGEQPKWTKRLPEFLAKTPATARRIAALKETPPAEGFSARVAASATLPSANSAGKS